MSALIDSFFQPRQLGLILLSGFVSGLVLTFLITRILSRAGVLDIPNTRSSHSSPTPRGGGLSIVLAFSAFLLLNLWFPIVLVDDHQVRALLWGGLLVAVIGGLDDVYGVPAAWRFFIHTCAAAISLSLLRSLPTIVVLGSELDSHYLVFVLLALSLMWFTNLFNFMDGIDGIAGIETVTVLFGAALILSIHGESDWAVILGFLAACSVGFLVWNWEPAKVFMGDACSGFLGFTLGLIAVATSMTNAISLWVWVILFGVFVVDSTTTLITRIATGERWFSAHRTHAYQVLSRRLHSHSRVSVAVGVINLFWLLPIGLLAARDPFWAFPLCVVALLPLTILAKIAGAGRSKPRSLES